MKHGQLHSIAHNFAESLASGLGFVVGYCPVYVFGEALANSNSTLEIDFLTGHVYGDTVSEELATAALTFKVAFPSFCDKNGASISNFVLFGTRFIARPIEETFVVTIQDDKGRKSSREYRGMPGKRLKVLDKAGRVIPKLTK